MWALVLLSLSSAAYSKFTQPPSLIPKTLRALTLSIFKKSAGFCLAFVLASPLRTRPPSDIHLAMECLFCTRKCRTRISSVIAADSLTRPVFHKRRPLAPCVKISDDFGHNGGVSLRLCCCQKLGMRLSSLQNIVGATKP